MFKTLKNMFQKKSSPKEITIKINADTTELDKTLDRVSEQVQETREELERVSDDSHIKLVTNDDGVPELYIDGNKADGIVDIKYRWHTATDKEPTRYGIDVTYYVGEFEHHETIKDIVHAQMDKAAIESMLNEVAPMTNGEA